MIFGSSSGDYAVSARRENFKYPRRAGFRDYVLSRGQGSDVDGTLAACREVC